MLLDANSDGVLSKYEYDSEIAFETMDSDRNASLSAAELQAVLGPLNRTACRLPPTVSSSPTWMPTANSTMPRCAAPPRCGSPGSTATATATST